MAMRVKYRPETHLHAQLWRGRRAALWRRSCQVKQGQNRTFRAQRTHSLHNGAYSKKLEAEARNRKRKSWPMIAKYFTGEFNTREGREKGRERGESVSAGDRPAR